MEMWIPFRVENVQEIGYLLNKVELHIRHEDAEMGKCYNANPKDTDGYNQAWNHRQVWSDFKEQILQAIAKRANYMEKRQLELIQNKAKQLKDDPDADLELIKEHYFYDDVQAELDRQFEKGDLTDEQYEEICERVERLSKELKKTVKRIQQEILADLHLSEGQA